MSFRVWFGDLLIEVRIHPWWSLLVLAACAALSRIPAVQGAWWRLLGEVGF